MLMRRHAERRFSQKDSASAALRAHQPGTVGFPCADPAGAIAIIAGVDGNLMSTRFDWNLDIPRVALNV
jgi:hypothetical protein